MEDIRQRSVSQWRSYHSAFRSLCVDDPECQSQALASLVSQYPFSRSSTASTWIRLASSTPFKSLRLAIIDMIKTADPNYLPIKVSRFMTNVLDIEEAEKDPTLAQVLQDTFLRTGRVSCPVRVLTSHPTYLVKFRASISLLMTGEGPLPLCWRNYLAIMACAEMHCPSMVAMQQHFFLINEGPEEWLAGLSHAPPQLAALGQINQLMAHRPWLVSSSNHIRPLLCSQNHNWSATELVHALVILASYHAVSSLSLSLGCEFEPDMPLFVPKDSSFDIWFPETEERGTSTATTAAASTVVNDDDTNKLLMKLVQSETDMDQLLNLDKEEEPFEDAAGSATATATTHHSSSTDTSTSSLEAYLDTSTTRLEYEDFDVRSREYSVLHTEDFSWEEHGFSTVSRYLGSDNANALDTQWKLILNLTYGAFGECNTAVDTTPFRRAIWYYMHRIFGVCHDDYRYHEVNVFVSRSVKMFVKKAACVPWKLFKDDFELCGAGQLRKGNNNKKAEKTSEEAAEQVTRGGWGGEDTDSLTTKASDVVSFTQDEKCHVTLLAVEARKQAEMMYALRAVMEHMMS